MGMIYIFMATFTWALDTLIRYPLLKEGISADRLVLIEHLFLSLIFVPVLYKSRESWWNGSVRSLFYFVFIGIGGSALATLAFTKAFILMSPTVVILLQKLQFLVAIMAAKIILNEKIKKEFLIWAALALIGALLISSSEAMFELLSLKFYQNLFSKNSFIGLCYTLLAVLLWGISTAMGKKLSSDGFSTKQIMGGRFIMGLFGMILYLSLSHQLDFSIINFQLMQLWRILLMVLLSGVLGMYFYYHGLKRISARLCAILEMFFPISAILINWIFLDIKLTSVQLVGAGILLLSSFVVQLRHI